MTAFFPSHLMGSGFLLACLTPSPRHFAPGIWYAENCWNQRGLWSCGCCATKLGWHPDPAMPQVLPRNDAPRAALGPQPRHCLRVCASSLCSTPSAQGSNFSWMCQVPVLGTVSVLLGQGRRCSVFRLFECKMLLVA